MKKLFLLVVTLLTVVSLSYAQYTIDSSFPNKTLSADSVLIGQGNGLHGVAVGLDGNVWTVNYNYYVKGDSLPVTSTGKNTAVLPLRVFKPDGTPASFSPLMILKGGSVTDTLWKGNTGRGLANTPDGNILFTWFGNVYLLDYRTGAVITKIIASAKNSGTAAAADVAGNIYTSPVAPLLEPLQIWNKSGVNQGNVTDTTKFYSRTLTVSRAGDKVYYAGYTSHSVIRYTGDPLLGFTADTVLKGFDCEAITRSGKTDMLWAAAGSGNDKPNRYGNLVTSYSSHTWYLWDPSVDKIKDSIKWNGLETFSNADSLGVRPRGVSTSTNGDTVYVCMFGAKTGMYSIQRFVKGPNSVRREEGIIAQDFSLAQNYPNPFNPSTQISFSLLSSSRISLKVYDVLGKEVATLANGEYSTGSYKAEFNATNLSAGMYFYTLKTSNGFSQTKKMLLIK